MKIAVFYHCLLFMGDPPELLPLALDIVQEQMQALETSGLLDVADELIIGINGGPESEDIASLIFPPKAKIVYHGLRSRSENLTICELEKWLPEHDDYYVLYFHSKGVTHAAGNAFREAWRKCMMVWLVWNWNICVKDLDLGYECAGCHWLTGRGWDKSQNLFGGNFWWAKASYLLTLPPLRARERIRISGIGDIESRFEAEVWIGNGPRLPMVRNYHWHDPSTGKPCMMMQ